MRALALCGVTLAAVAAMPSMIPAQARAQVPKQAPATVQATPHLATSAAYQALEKYCAPCHGAKNPEAGLSITSLMKDYSVDAKARDWEDIAERLETRRMPPQEATAFPSDEERAAAVSWIRTTLREFGQAHAGDPGPVTVRRLTSAEYQYAVRDLTGIDIRVGLDTSNDAVGGEGFLNVGDVQFVHDSSVERYLEAARLVADHAVIGAGPLEFHCDPGRTGLELSALSRINELYDTRGFRVVSGEGGRPFGLERYGKAFYVAWHYKHRVALGDPQVTLRGLAAKEGITGRFAEHIWSVVNKPGALYPTRLMTDRWRSLPSPSSDVAASIAKAREGTTDLYKYLTTWPSWFFARGDLAAGGAGDESPLSFDDDSLKAEPTFRYALAIANVPGRRAAAAQKPGPVKVHLQLDSVNPSPGVKPVVIWRNPRVVTRTLAPGAALTDPAAVADLLKGGGVITSTKSLKSLLTVEASRDVAFGASPDGSTLGPDDFATAGSIAFDVPIPEGTDLVEFQSEAELGAERNAVVRVVVADRAEGSPGGRKQRALMADPKSLGYKAFRAGIAEYAALLPPNSHGEANPADKDPIPRPFDNTYNGAEHDAFILKVKYQRADDFFARNLVDGAARARLDQAWNDLFGSWPYHDAYLGMLIDHYKLNLKSRRMEDMDAVAMAELPKELRQYVEPLRAHYERVMAAQKAAQPGHVDQAIAFASRAWRRPLTLDEKAKLRAYYRKARTTLSLDHQDAIRALLARVLMSPAFLYRTETVARGAEKPLGGSEIASRMSFFLWSSLPDDELRRAASAGELASPAKLAAQVRRMLADPRARRFATEFFGQWLGFYGFDRYTGVDPGRFPEFTDEVKSAMYDEAVSTFEYIVRNERPVMEFLDADYAFLNQALVKFYDLKLKKDTVVTDTMVKVDGARAFNRGGVIRLGSVLTSTSAPLRTSPVKRGDWVLRRLLGTPTPPPPADAGTLPADDHAFEGMTLRQKLTQHKRNATCAACHMRIDPLGFPLEGFDAVGRTRAAYSDGKAVDDTGEFADKSTLVGSAGLAAYLRSQDTQVMKTLSKKMIGYALGRTVRASDQPLIDEMMRLGGSSTFSDLAAKVVTSRQFRNHAGESDGPPPAAAPPSSKVAPRESPQKEGVR
jgi:mono/diheme cytochrome c family protein